jgi:hypothetical protein
MAGNDIMANIVRREDGTCWRVVRVLKDDPNMYMGDSMWLKVEYSPELTDLIIQNQQECEKLLQNMTEKQQMLEKELIKYRKTQWVQCSLM